MTDDTMTMPAFGQEPASGAAPGGAPKPKLTGLQKAVVLLVGLGQDRASKVLKHVDEEEAELMMAEMARTRTVPPHHIEAISTEVVENVIAQGYFYEGGLGMAEKMLEATYGADRAKDILSRLRATIEVRPFKFLVRVPADQIFNFIRRENPQTIALIMSYLSERQQSQLLQMFPAGQQAEIVQRIANMKQISPKMLAELEKEVRERMFNIMSQDTGHAIGGVDAVAQMINMVDRQTERNVFTDLEARDAELADQIRKRLFIFEDILKLDDRAMRLVVQQCDTADLALALRLAPEELRDKFFSAMSERASESLADEIELMSPQRRRDVESAQTKIVGLVRKLEEDGEIIISRRGEDEEVV